MDKDQNNNNIDLIKEGINQLDSALSNFIEIKGCDHATAISRVAHGLLEMAQLAYTIYKAK